MTSQDRRPSGRTVHRPAASPAPVIARLREEPRPHTNQMFDLTYTLRDHGWATATYGNGEVSFAVNASYLGDPLGDLARAARGLLRGLPQVTFGFIQEPGEHRLVLSRRNDEAEVRAYRLPEMFASGVERGELVLVAPCTVRSFTNTAINCLRHVLDEHGEEEYLRRWKGHPFPMRELDDLLSLR